MAQGGEPSQICKILNVTAQPILTGVVGYVVSRLFFPNSTTTKYFGIDVSGNVLFGVACTVGTALGDIAATYIIPSLDKSSWLSNLEGKIIVPVGGAIGTLAVEYVTDTLRYDGV